MESNNIHGLISILMPTFNVEKYIVEAVNSILQQTYQNFELIIVDDASTDNTYTYLEELSMKDSRIKLYRNNQNLKIVKSLNFALTKARGEYISRMDGDDVSYPERLELLKNFLDRHKKYSLVGSQVSCINEYGEVLSKSKLLLTNKYIRQYSRYQSPILHIWLARREVYEELQGYRNCPYVEDYDFLLRGISKGFFYANLDKILYKVRYRNGNTATSNGLIQQKAKIEIFKIHSIENKYGKIVFDETLFNQKLRISDFENRRYMAASRHLELALRNQKKLLLVIKEVIIASFLSKFILYKLFSSLMIKVGSFIERKMLKMQDEIYE